MATPPRLRTAVVGAGPAGLLFALTARLLSIDRAEHWHIRLFDKREQYTRTHRLRMDPAPYRRISERVRSDHFDALMQYLTDEDFRPAANHLEARLASLLGSLGIKQELLTVGRGPGECDLTELVDRMAPTGDRSHPLTIVGADSVRSTVRNMVGADNQLVRETHQTVARLTLTGIGLPAQLGPVEQFKMAKLLESILDYRLNPNGYAEIDLFLSDDEHEAVSALGAQPVDPVVLDEALLAGLRAPLFGTIARHLASDIGSRVELQSTFHLEHQYSPRVTFQVPGAHVFLVGDAAVSLPYFRGMASLATNALALAEAHAGVVDGADVDDAAVAYEAAAAATVDTELRTVRRRDRMVGAAREVVRISSVVPFPLQSWLLSTRTSGPADRRLSGAVVANLLLAIIAAAIAVVAPLLGGFISAPLGWIWIAALPVQALGGFTFENARALESEPNRWLRLVWQVQLSVLLLVGLPLAFVASSELGRPAQLYAPVAWFVLGLAFVAGMYGATERSARSG